MLKSKKPKTEKIKASRCSEPETSELMSEMYKGYTNRKTHSISGSYPNKKAAFNDAEKQANRKKNTHIGYN